MPARDPFDELTQLFYHAFGTLDAEFRDFERSSGRFNMLPKITLPSVKTYSESYRTINDGESIRYFKNGMLHNDEGPAVIYQDKDKQAEYWLNGIKSTEKDVEEIKLKKEDERKHTIYLDSVPYEVTGKQLKQIKDNLKSVLKIEEKK